MSDILSVLFTAVSTVIVCVVIVIVVMWKMFSAMVDEWED